MSRANSPNPRPLPMLSGMFAVAALCAAFAAPVPTRAADGEPSPGIVITPPDATPPAVIRTNTVRPNEPLTTNALIGYINSEPVFALDIFRPIDDDLRNLARTSSNFRRDAMPLIRDQIQDYINESLIVTAAQATLTDGDKQLLDANLNKESSSLLSKYGDGSEAAANKILAASGSTLQKEKAELKRQLIVRIYMSKNLAPKIVTTRQMVLDAYEKDPAKWQETASVEMYSITLPVAHWLRQPATNAQQGPIIANPTPEQVKNAEADAMAQARTIVATLNKSENKPADFARLAEDNSSEPLTAKRGGRTANVVKGSMVNTQLENYLFSLPAHTVGQPQLIRDSDPHLSAVVVLMVGDKNEARTVSFEEAQDQIVKTLRDQQFRELQAQYLEKLYKGGAVEGLDRMINVAVDAAVTRYATN